MHDPLFVYCTVAGFTLARSSSTSTRLFSE
jgi:hypothetical protein